MSDKPKLRCKNCDVTKPITEVPQVEVTPSQSRYECSECGKTNFRFIEPDYVKEPTMDQHREQKRQSKIERLENQR